MHWVRWKKLCNSKLKGGLGFRDLGDFNMALLEKQGWRIIQNPDSLVGRILKARYFPDCSFFEAIAKKNSSFLWRSIIAAKPLLRKGCFWRVGNGQSIRIWKGVWGKGGMEFDVDDGFRNIDGGVCVSELINEHDGAWDENLVRDNFESANSSQILRIPLCSSMPMDRLIWNETASGLFSVKSAYHINRSRAGVSNRDDDDQPWKKLWNTKATPRCKLLVWRICNNVIPIKPPLRRRGFCLEDWCLVCKKDVESAVHIFRDCTLDLEVWKRLPFSNVILGPSFSDPVSWIRYIAWNLKEDE